MSEDIVAGLRAALGDERVLVGDRIPDRARSDWSGDHKGRPLAVVRPETTAHVSQTLALCSAHGVPIVPQGGMTGLAGGADPIDGGIALSLERMSGIEELDPVMATMTVLSGTPLETVQKAADDAGMMFPLDLGARGSCTIGGNLSTNAGGNRVIRYGMARDHVLGLEVVLPSGEVLSSLNKLVKNNAGYDLKQLFIGSEGTLGIITRAVLRLQPKPVSSTSAIVGCRDFAALLEVLRRTRARLGPTLSAFEFMWPSFLDFMVEHIEGVQRPLAGRHGAYALIEASGFEMGKDREQLEACLGELMAEGVIDDAVVAQSERESQTFWRIREGVAEYPRIVGITVPYDIGMQTGDIGTFVEALERTLNARWPDALVHFFGHIGDSNLHIVVGRLARENLGELNDIVYGAVRAAGGTVSAEHGIGTHKKPYLGYTRSPGELALMLSIKRALDPKNILNPGKVIG